MSTQSPFSIIYTPEGQAPITLAEVGSWLDWPTFEGSQSLFERDGVMAANSFFRPLGGAMVAITFTVEEDMPDLITALDDFIDTLMPDGGSLAFNAEDGTDPIIFPRAVISITPALPTGPVATVARSISIQASLPAS